MASYGKAPEAESHAAGEEGLRRYDTLLQKRECLRGLECRTGRILSHDGTVEQRLVLVAREQIVVYTTLSSYHHSGVISGTADHAQNLTG